jgi:hypothetical protein
MSGGLTWKIFSLISEINLNVLLFQDILIQITAANCYNISNTCREILFDIISSNLKILCIVSIFLQKAETLLVNGWLPR